MNRAARVLKAVVVEAVGIVADDWTLPLGIGVLILLAWLGVRRGEAALAAFGLAVAMAVWVGGISVRDGRARRRSANAALHSKSGGRVPDRDQPDPQGARPAAR